MLVSTVYMYYERNSTHSVFLSYIGGSSYASMVQVMACRLILPQEIIGTI